MSDQLYLTVQTEGVRMRVIHLSVPLYALAHGWVTRDALQPDMPTLTHQLFAAHPGVQQLYIGSHYVGFFVEENIWTRHLEQQLIDIIVESRGFNRYQVEQVIYPYYKAVCLNYIFALSDDELFVLV